MEILEILNHLSDYLNTILLNSGMWAPLFSSLLIILEGIFAFLPMCVFVTINILTMGKVLGIIISYCCTVIGGFLSFILCRLGFHSLFQRFIKNKKGLNKFMELIDNISFRKLVLIISIPFTPSFLVNLAAGLSEISKKKFLYALLLGKTCTILFWGFLGVNIIECLTNPLIFAKIVIMILICNIIAMFINKN